MIKQLLVIVLLIGVASADKSEWCGTIVAIYGVCSEQLIDNWLYHTGVSGELKQSLTMGPLPEPELVVAKVQVDSIEESVLPLGLEPYYNLDLDTPEPQKVEDGGEKQDFEAGPPQLPTGPLPPPNLPWYWDRMWMVS